LPHEAIELAIEELTRDRSALSPANANREIYQLLKQGIPSRISVSEDAELVETVRVIDWNNPTNNDFFLASQFWISGEVYRKRADLVGFVNGLPLIFIELKAAHKRLEKLITITCATTRIPFPKFSGITRSSYSPMGIRAGSAA
jgi:type I restriction enzyme, R subunit